MNTTTTTTNKSDTGSGDLKTSDSIKFDNTIFDTVNLSTRKSETPDKTTKVEDASMNAIMGLVGNCKIIVDEAFKNAKEGHKFSRQLAIYITNNSVCKKDAQGNCEKDNNGNNVPNVTETKAKIGKEVDGDFTFLGNHNAANLQEHLGQWSKTNGYKYEGRYFPTSFGKDSKDQPKDMGVETLPSNQRFYGKFDQKDGFRLSGAYVWDTTESPNKQTKYIGSFDKTGIAGFGCMEKIVNSKKLYVVAEFETDNKTKVVGISGEYYIVIDPNEERETHRIRYYSTKNKSEYLIFKDADRKTILEKFNISTMNSKIEELDGLESVYQYVEKNTGIGRTKLWGIVAAVTAAAGLYWAYNRYKSSPKKTQKKSRGRFNKFMNSDDWSSSSSSSSSSNKNKKSAAPASASAAAPSASSQTSASAALSAGVQNKDSNAKEDASAAPSAGVQNKDSNAKKDASAAPSAGVQNKDSNAPSPVKQQRGRKNQTKKSTPAPAPTRTSARIQNLKKKPAAVVVKKEPVGLRRSPRNKK
jgi:cytoskeletal protein RodZ